MKDDFFYYWTLESKKRLFIAGFAYTIQIIF